jgi:hypothetical protein
MDSPLVLMIELVHLVPLHVACEYRRGVRVVNYWHLEQEHVVRGGRRTSH